MKCIQKYKLAMIIMSVALFTCISSSQKLLEAEGRGNTYELILSKGLKLEVPDCAHPVKHVSEAWDTDLKKYVFVFDAHRDIDNDRCKNFDRQRTEITVADTLAPDSLAGRIGTAFTYTWKFKLDPAFQPSSSFCHIHQIKAVGGPDEGMPLMTLTPRAGKPEKLQLIYTPSKGTSGGGILAEVDLLSFLGEWVEATESVSYSHHGTYSIVLKRIKDGAALLTYGKSDLDLWRDGAYFLRPKFGIYRSLKNVEALRDESVRFADFSILQIHTSK
jgi:hypothetical protein